MAESVMIINEQSSIQQKRRSLFPAYYINKHSKDDQLRLPLSISSASSSSSGQQQEAGSLRRRLFSQPSANSTATNTTTAAASSSSNSWKGVSSAVLRFPIYAILFPIRSRSTNMMGKWWEWVRGWIQQQQHSASSLLFPKVVDLEMMMTSSSSMNAECDHQVERRVAPPTGRLRGCWTLRLHAFHNLISSHLTTLFSSSSPNSHHRLPLSVPN